MDRVHMFEQERPKKLSLSICISRNIRWLDIWIGLRHIHVLHYSITFHRVIHKWWGIKLDPPSMRLDLDSNGYAVILDSLWLPCYFIQVAMMFSPLLLLGISQNLSLCGITSALGCVLSHNHPIPRLNFWLLDLL